MVKKLLCPPLTKVWTIAVPIWMGITEMATSHGTQGFKAMAWGGVWAVGWDAAPERSLLPLSSTD